MVSVSFHSESIKTELLRSLFHGVLAHLMYTNVDCVIHTRVMSIYLYSLYIASILIVCLFFSSFSLSYTLHSLNVCGGLWWVYLWVVPHTFGQKKTLLIYRQINDVNLFSFFWCLCGVCATSHRRWHQEKPTDEWEKSMKKQLKSEISEFNRTELHTQRMNCDV